MNRLFLFLALLLLAPWASAGKLLLVGGGTEQDSPQAWNAEPYRWAVRNAANRRVAVISHGPSSNWIPDYFVRHCGAAYARVFALTSRDTADRQDVMDSLLSYDMVFLKGGDQQLYFRYFRGTKTQQALERIFERGGVIAGTSAGMAILSEVVYTAANMSAASADCLRDPRHPDITLSGDFLPFFPGYVFDTHFVERGRLPRLLAFMGYWREASGQSARGLAVDDRTALAIDEQGLGTVFGTGAVSIFELRSPSGLGLGGHLALDSVGVVQLVQGCSYDFLRHEARGLEAMDLARWPASPEADWLLAGPSEQARALAAQALASRLGRRRDPVVLLAAQGQDAERMRSAGARFLRPRPAERAGHDDWVWADKIFLGPLGLEALRAMPLPSLAESKSVALVGESAFWAGQAHVAGLDEPDAASRGLARVEEGLALLPGLAVCPLWLEDPERAQNGAASLPFAVASQGLRGGIWLSERAVLRCQTRDGRTQLTNFGQTAALALWCYPDCRAGLAEQTDFGYPGEKPRALAGLSHYGLAVIPPGGTWLCPAW